MSHHAATTRRDLRHKVRRGVAFVEFEIDNSGDGLLRGDLTSVSVAGLTFEMDTNAALEQGTMVQTATMRLTISARSTSWTPMAQRWSA